MADGVLRGAGAMVPFMITTFTDLVLRVVLAFVLNGALGTDGIWTVSYTHLDVYKRQVEG